MMVFYVFLEFPMTEFNSIQNNKLVTGDNQSISPHLDTVHLLRLPKINRFPDIHRVTFFDDEYVDLFE